MKHQMRANPFVPREAMRDENGAQIEYYFSAIDEWLEEHNFDGKFNTNFYESIKEQWCEWGKLTPKQFDALARIYDRWVNR